MLVIFIVQSARFSSWSPFLEPLPGAPSWSPFLEPHPWNPVLELIPDPTGTDISELTVLTSVNVN